MNARRESGERMVFALIVAIDKYIAADSLPTLGGCVNDAKLFHGFLRTFCQSRNLKLHTQFLTNAAATRSGILSAFQKHLLNNSSIPDNGEATMIFYFAGHGSRVEAPTNPLPADGLVETICPHDERTHLGGKYVHGIPDYVLGWLLRSLAKKKGDNITVILDSCHSSGMARKDGTSRSARTWARPIPPELDIHLCDDTSQAPQSWAQSSASHVMLAACKQDESAMETAGAGQNVHGRFTQTLVTRLRSVPLGDTTYIELLASLDAGTLDGQTPTCNGFNRTRLVFSRKYPPGGQRSYPLKAPETTSPHATPTFKVDIGSVEGVVVGTEFAVCLDEKSIGHKNSTFVLCASAVKVHEAILIPMTSKPVPRSARVVVSDWKNDGMILRVYLPQRFTYTADLFPAPFPVHHRFVEAPFAKADIALYSAGNNLIIRQLKLDGVEDARIPLRGNQRNLPNIVDAIAHFNYFLHRENDDASRRIPGGALLEMYRLIGNIPERRPDDRFPNLVCQEESRYVTRLISEEAALYGFKIRNNSGEDLYPYLFYFDPEHYTIFSVYSHVSGTPPVRKGGGEFPIGMGGEKGWEFLLSQNQVSSSGYLKLFVSTTPLNLELICRLKPVDSSVGRLTMQPEQIGPKWDTVLVMLTMKRH
ncbi:caspase domain-containing protein [Mycena galericulata]|nr:caspase domain-containing protein [Mycena galericulata]